MRTTVRWLALLLAVPLAAGGPEPVPVRGVVLGPDGRPLADVLVRLRSPDGCCTIVPGHSFRTTRTGTDGAFRFDAPPAPMEVFVASGEHAPAWQPATDGVVVRLEEGAFVEGTVSAPARIRAARGLWEFAAVDADGAFRLGPLPAGVPLTISAASTGHRPQSRRVVLAAGEVQRVALALESGLSVRGRVVPAVPGTTIRASQGESRAALAPDGSFALTGLRDGPVRLVVLAPGREPRIVDGEAGGYLTVELDG